MHTTDPSPLNKASSHEDELGTAQSYLNSDKPLTPKMISSLMHVGVSLHTTRIHEEEKKEATTISFIYMIAIMFVSLSLATVLGSIFLYAYEIGPFYKYPETAGQ